MTCSIWEHLQILSKLKEAGKLSSDVGIRLLQPLGLVAEKCQPV
ncbi:hypothetical protein [Microcoleus sp. FACHB-SPT15]|nr:hypothetical protein [Microcoleus sp. FACHB-SPT15]